METTAIDNTTVSNNKVKRPNFLTGLCLLSFIGSGWGVVCGIVQFIKAEAQTKAVNNIKDILANEQFQLNISTDNATRKAMQMAENMSYAFSTGNLQIIAAAAFVGSVLCIIGVKFMWRQEKKGLYYYIGGILVGVITLLIMFGFTKVLTMGMLPLNGIITLFVLFGSSGALAMGISITIVTIWISFIIMYIRQLKYMY